MVPRSIAGINKINVVEKVLHYTPVFAHTRQTAAWAGTTDHIDPYVAHMNTDPLPTPSPPPPPPPPPPPKKRKQQQIKRGDKWSNKHLPLYYYTSLPLLFLCNTLLQTCGIFPTLLVLNAGLGQIAESNVN